MRLISNFKNPTFLINFLLVFIPSPLPYLAEGDQDSASMKPSCLHTTWAAQMEKSSSHTVPHSPLQKTSTRPSQCFFFSPARRTWITGELESDWALHSIHKHINVDKRQWMAPGCSITRDKGGQDGDLEGSNTTKDCQKQFKLYTVRLHQSIVPFKDKTQ